MFLSRSLDMILMMTPKLKRRPKFHTAATLTVGHNTGRL